ncbi:eukaryotic translation initiation factor 2-alpha kinase 1 isoform X1 [Diachasma alloeum]|uniref:eukaryotic translation initiation factor 2-alpha kinase 1 isoform X1 n=1 Tax=Diachasma alloeum TaxID=454923 RepID=UPI0007381D22|nr:eukaryotic translation initiation factor 2-alpha kinase 1 isoform X1 [Diachasma alloeum]
MSNDNGNKFNPWQSLETISTFDNGNNSRTTRRLDEAHDGASGGQIVGRVAPSTSLLIESLLKSICAMFETDPTRRNKLYFILCDKLHEMRLIDSSYNMMEFESMRGQYQQAWYNLMTVARAAAGSESIIEFPNLSPDWSRYAVEFDEREFIASGGFGNVYRAVHRLDGHEYAIKKIVVKSGRVKNILQQLEEVKTLAKLNHTNIVAYKCAWIEHNLPHSLRPLAPAKSRTRTKRSSLKRLSSDTNSCETQSANQFKTSFSSDRVRSDSASRVGMYIKNSVNHQINREWDSYGSTCHCDVASQRFQEFNSTIDIIGRRIDGIVDGVSVERQNSDVVSFRNDDGENVDDRSVSSDSSDIEEIQSPLHTDEGRGRICPYYSPRVRYATIYIQMALCEKTLRAWLDERLEATPEPIATTILKQILDGLHYMHSRDIVHHDIKPSNIFIGAIGQRVEIQVGDFGLACPRKSESHHPVFGTELYAAPEQLNGQCNPKSDLYSLGIVLFEIFFPMKTGMERNSLITQLKSGKMPGEFIEKNPKWSDTIKRLLLVDPTRRPSTTELLHNLNADKDSIIAELTNRIKEKDVVIDNLRMEIKELRLKLDKVELVKTLQMP